ncbi:hypothetical protein PAXRUDRAFT_19848 [Paxillus rubicundulus Ve08.2h10]|uniref:Secreted protein n=1 Tax=Paxillus rubicundulus Ve08.2h10 TaxID=930991 RepID=A0A0D0CTW2_9AGAM|nr:hypothetical protein PAXRUDRAFT_19848 [Paxillus rubicundulus Ve08.2h10]
MLSSSKTALTIILIAARCCMCLSSITGRDLVSPTRYSPSHVHISLTIHPRLAKSLCTLVIEEGSE